MSKKDDKQWTLYEQGVDELGTAVRKLVLCGQDCSSMLSELGDAIEYYVNHFEDDLSAQERKDLEEFVEDVAAIVRLRLAVPSVEMQRRRRFSVKLLPHT